MGNGRYTPIILPNALNFKYILQILPLQSHFCAKGRQKTKGRTYMKQKFTLNIADMQISVITEAPAAEVERIRGLLDRKMREIYLSSRCPKTEAALLCAMEFAADRMSFQDQISTLEERCEKYSVVLEGLKERTAEQTAELDKLKGENAVLRSLVTGGNVAPDPISPAKFFAEVAEAQSDRPEVAPAPVVEEEPVDEMLRKPRSRVGSMFEQLSFGDIN